MTDVFSRRTIALKMRLGEECRIVKGIIIEESDEDTQGLRIQITGDEELATAPVVLTIEHQHWKGIQRDDSFGCVFYLDLSKCLAASAR